MKRGSVALVRRRRERFAAVEDFGRARPILNKALGILPRSARTQTLIGTLKEFEASQFNPDDAPTISTANEPSGRGWFCFTRPNRITGKRCATTRTTRWPTFDWDVFFIWRANCEKLARARRGLKIANEPLTQYLGALFMGALQQEEKDIAGARGSFEQAVAMVPNSQPAVVALVDLEVMAGPSGPGPRSDARTCRAPPTTDPRPAIHNGGLDSKVCGGCANG